MHKARADLAVEIKDSVVTRIGRSYIQQPATDFSGGSIKWHEDKMKHDRLGHDRQHMMESR